MKKKLLLAVAGLLAATTLVGCNTPDNKKSNIPEIKMSENKFINKTGKEMMDLGFDAWCKKVDEVGICYEFNGQYTEAFARQLYPTYFDCYLYADGSVFGTYKANYVESEHDPNGRYYYCDGDGHEENEVWFGYWYNKTDDGEDVLNIQWLGYGDYYSGHICQYSKTSDAIISGDTYSAAISLAINGNSRTCFIYGKEYSNYKPETLKVEKTSKTPTSMIGADQVPNYTLKVTCERENGTVTEFGQYLFDWSFDANGDITAEYPLLGLKKEKAVNIPMTPTVYETKIDAGEGLVDCKITRNTSDTAILEIGEKKAVIKYDETYYRLVFDIVGLVNDPSNTMTAAEFANIKTKYFFIGKGNEYLTDNGLVKEAVSDPSGNHLVPEVGHYKCVESTTSLDPLSKLAVIGGYNGVASDMDKVHIEKTKGPTGVHTDGAELIRFSDYANLDSNGNPIELVAFRILVNTNGEFVSYMGYVDSYDSTTHELRFAGVHKWGNNINGRTYMRGVILNDTNGTFLVSVADTNY